MKQKMKLTPLEKSWILYDIGNSAFTLLVSTLIPIYFNSLAGAAGVNEDMYLSYWGYAGSISTIVFGRLSAKYDTGLLIKICIVCYTCITAFGMFLVSLWQFWVLATLVGMFQGGIQALARSYLGKIIRPERSGEFYGLMDICGKGASFLGTTLVAFVSQVTAGIEVNIFGIALQNENLAVGSLIILFAIGYVIFCKADKLNKARMSA